LEGDLSDLVDTEFSKASMAISDAFARLTKLQAQPIEVEVHGSILEAAMTVTNAIAKLIKSATETQHEIMLTRGSKTRTAFYRKNNRWTEGLISAAKAVASSTNTLIETADGVLSGKNTPEQLIVASNDVAASTAQLVAASRVKAHFTRCQEELEVASKAVSSACRALVRQVQALINVEEDTVDFTKLGPHDFKVKEMEQQVFPLLSIVLPVFYPLSSSSSFYRLPQCLPLSLFLLI
jgi:huntingtin-interacting protein 1-related protein